MKREVMWVVAMAVLSAATSRQAWAVDCGKGTEPGCAWFDAGAKQFQYVTGSGTHTVTTVADWKTCRALIIANMQKALGPLPDGSRRVPLDVKVLTTMFISPSATNLPRLVMKRVSYATETNDYREAWLLMPLGLKGPRPAILCLHQSNSMLSDEPAGLRGSPNLFYAKELAERGYVTLAPDYQAISYAPPRQARDPYGMGYESFMMKGIWNHMRAVDLLQSLPDVDPGRIGCIGHSLGGMNTLWVAAFDERVKVAVISGGLSSFRRVMTGGKGVADWARPGYVPRIASVYNNDLARIPFDFSGVLACLAPRPVFVNAPLRDYVSPIGGRECVEAAATVYALFGATGLPVLLQPDAHHDFPPETRTNVYAGVDAILKP